jgi:hypothetical protein
MCYGIRLIGWRCVCGGCAQRGWVILSLLYYDPTDPAIVGGSRTPATHPEPRLRAAISVAGANRRADEGIDVLNQICSESARCQTEYTNNPDDLLHLFCNDATSLESSSMTQASTACAHEGTTPSCISSAPVNAWPSWGSGARPGAGFNS